MNKFKQKNSHALLNHGRALLILLVLGMVILIPTAATRAQHENSLSDLWIDLSMGAPLVDLFNQSARSEDIARVEHVSQLDLLSDVTTGKKLVVFKSADDAIRLLPHIHNDFDIVGYNLEHGPANPLNEQEDPVGSIERLREVVDEYGMELALGPDHQFAESDAVAMAPYADYLILQIQKVQTEPETVYNFVLPIIEGARKANPDIEISVQIRTEGDVNELLTMLAPLHEKIDGISILTSEETIDVSKELLGSLRESRIGPTPVPLLDDLAQNSRESVDSSDQGSGKTPIGEELLSGSNAPLATVVASVLENPDASESVETLSAKSTGNTISTAEANQRTGSNWLLAILALVIGIALGAGYVSYRTGS